MIDAARTISQQPHHYFTDQLHNPDGIAGYYPLAEEIWAQTNGTVDAFVHCVGTGASSRGVATVLKRHRADVKIVAVEPAESSVLRGEAPGPHKIEGVGIGYIPPLWEPSLMDEVMAVKTDDAKEMARRLAREEGLFAGTSSGANVLAAIRLGLTLGPDATVVTLMVDTGLKYLSTDVFRLGLDADEGSTAATTQGRRSREGNAISSSTPSAWCWWQSFTAPAFRIVTAPSLSSRVCAMRFHASSSSGQTADTLAG